MLLAHVTLATRDVAKTAQFYEAIFGWKRIERPGQEGPAGVWLQINDVQELHITLRGDFVAASFEDEFGRHFAVRVDAAEMGDVVARLLTAQAELMEPKRETESRRVFFRDPSGYVVELTQCE